MLGKILVALGVSAVVSAFSFNASTPSECGDLTVTWSGGTAPYTLAILPTFGTQRVHNISDSAYSNGKGSYTFELLVSANTEILISMSDATGFNAGGTSELLTVASNSSSACSTTDPGTSFVYELNSALAQCRTYTFSGYSAAVQPITINAVVPGGTGLTITPPKSSASSYDWTVDVAAGTSLVFFLSDSQGNLGGVSNVLEVTNTSDSSCLDSASPSSTMTPIASSTGSPNSSSPSGVSKAAVGGAIAGVVAGIGALLSIVWFFYRKRQQNSRRQHLMDLNGDYSSNQGSTAYLASGRYDATPLAPTPFPLTEPPMSYESTVHSPHPPPSPGVMSSTGFLSSNGSRRKGATSTSSSSQYNPRLIVHTDAADEDELIELPPSYSERRRPIPGLAVVTSSTETPQQQASRRDQKVPTLPPPPRTANPSDPSSRSTSPSGS